MVKNMLQIVGCVSGLNDSKRMKSVTVKMETEKWIFIAQTARNRGMPEILT